MFCGGNKHKRSEGLTCSFSFLGFRYTIIPQMPERLLSQLMKKNTCSLHTSHWFKLHKGIMCFLLYCCFSFFRYSAFVHGVEQ